MLASPLSDPNCPRDLLRARIAELECEVATLRAAEKARRQGWTPAAEEIVRSGYARGYAADTIRAELIAKGHFAWSSGSIRYKAKELGCLPVKGVKYWTEPEDAIVRERYTAGDSIASIRRALLDAGFYRKFGAIQMRLIHMGISGARRRDWAPDEERIALAGLASGKLHREIVEELAKRGFERTKASLNKLAQKHGLLRGHREWTDEEKERLEQLYKTKTSARQVAHALGRDVSATISMASKLGIKMRIPWSEAENEVLIAGARDGRRLVDVAKEIGRPYVNVAAQARRLGLSFQRTRAAA